MLNLTNIFSILIMACAASAASAAEIGLLEALKHGEQFNPRLAGAKYQEQAAAQNVTVQRSRYLPELSAAAIASTGSPGSFSMFDVDSEISSSQRVGEGGALVLKQDLWDFGRTGNAVEAAKARQEVRHREISVITADVDITILKTYLNCSFLRAQVENSSFMADQAALLAKETDRFVRSGQRSIVERYLVDAEAKEAETRIAEFKERLSVTEERLALELGRPANEKVACSDLAGIGQALQKLEEKKAGANPLIDAQKARVQVARSRLDQAKAEARPLLYGAATGGYFDNSALKDKTIYAAGVGLKIPLFEGFRIDSGIRESEAELHAEESGLDSSKLSVDRANSQFDEQIQALKVRLDFLERERKLAKSVFTLAKKRYMSLQGTMIDLRESIRNMNRILISTDEAYRDLFVARGERALVNGSRP